MNQEKFDLPRNVIIVLVILSVIISILGSWTVMQETRRLQTFGIVKGSSSDTGTVSVTIADSTPRTSSVTGKVAVEILEVE